MKTVCEKCVFADYADSTEPCKMNIIEQIKEYHQPAVSDSNFYTIADYYCRYGFNLDIYDKNKKEIGSIEQLKQNLTKKAQMRYYLVIDINNPDTISVVADTIVSLAIKPQFVSFILHQNNNTESIISILKTKLDSIVEWKIHNFLEETTLNSAVATVFDTNSKKNDTYYFWLNSDKDYKNWNNEIIDINRFIYLYQPKCHGLFRNASKEGMLMSFDSYKQMRIHLDSDIFKALDSIEHPSFIYYA